MIIVKNDNNPNNDVGTTQTYFKLHVKNKL